ncbi:hypothetical protein ABZ613_15645 [Streptomyces collinus]|uniref:hypothetical protein n=1 Tax=Streptomyces collinus TaxID=42684 RepID=UPI0033CD04D5
MGSPAARAALERLSVKPGGPASWEDAEAAQHMLYDLEAKEPDAADRTAIRMRVSDLP